MRLHKFNHMFKQTQACSDYQLDVTADKFGACKCGFPKADHGVGCGARRPSQERKSSVGDRAAMFGPAGTDKYTTARRPSAGAPAVRLHNFNHMLLSKRIFRHMRTST